MFWVHIRIRYITTNYIAFKPQLIPDRSEVNLTDCFTKIITLRGNICDNEGWCESLVHAYNMATGSRLNSSQGETSKHQVSLSLISSSMKGCGGWEARPRLCPPGLPGPDRSPGWSAELCQVLAPGLPLCLLSTRSHHGSTYSPHKSVSSFFPNTI